MHKNVVLQNKFHLILCANVCIYTFLSLCVMCAPRVNVKLIIYYTSIVWLLIVVVNCWW